MNRRGFLAALAAVPAAAVVGLRPPFTWERPTATGIMGWDNMTLAQPITFENIWKAIDGFKVPFPETWDYESMLDMPKTKPIIDYQWGQMNKALWGDDES